MTASRPYHRPDLGDAGVLAPGRWRWLRALGWMVLMFALVGLVASLPNIAAAHAALPPGTALPLSLVAIAVAYLLYAGLVRWGEKRRPSELAPRPAATELAIGLAVGLGMFALVFTILRLSGLYTLAPGGWTDWPVDIGRDLGTGLIEELLIRLIVFRLVSRAFGIPFGLAISAALFGLAHLANPNASAFAAFAIGIEAGLMLAAFYVLTGRIWMSVGVHAAWNFAQGSVFGARVSGLTDTGSLFVSGPVAGASPLLSGGAFGPEASLPAVAVGVAVAWAVLRASWRQGAARAG